MRVAAVIFVGISRASERLSSADLAEIMLIRSKIRELKVATDGAEDGFASQEIQALRKQLLHLRTQYNLLSDPAYDEPVRD